MKPRIDAMRKRLDTSRKLNAQHLEAFERAKATVGTENPTREQLMGAYTDALRELADGGDQLAQRRIELADEASRRLGDAAYQQNLRLPTSASRGGTELARTRIDARNARSGQVAGRGGSGTDGPRCCRIPNGSSATRRACAGRAPTSATSRASRSAPGRARCSCRRGVNTTAYIRYVSGDITRLPEERKGSPWAGTGPPAS
ncbi:hypothetical protein BRM3_04820 [Brachybacterium huguangmaarense]|uniref:Uncharacterized protein n=1 Tax=Brachybacterium huguangmaarense TaxID=1652028 RepID=A0ABY6G3Q2_9MICO|nr:hypothetical protein [Brachybacterium huguangmaarense]UYG17747.1 hypothetical protein BRM3_04820 [Brachybacterium huguangmaarense]